MLHLSWEQVAAWRARRHHLDARVPHERMLEVVSRLCGVHAQVMSSAELTLWARVAGLVPDDVQRALWEKRTLVKQWAMRGTLHLLPADELPMWLGGLSTYRHYLKPGWFRGFGITEGELEQLIAAVAEALDGMQLTREELAAEVERITGSPEQAERVRGSWGSLLKPATYRGLLCFAPGEGTKVRFTSPRSWVDPGPPLEGAAALAEIFRRYLAAHGPAPREDVARWWATTPAAAGRTLAAIEDAIEVDAEGVRAWMLAGDAAQAAAAEPFGDLRLLPGFDQYVIAATRHADRLMPADFTERVYRPQGWISPVIAEGGRIVGTWRSERKGARLHVEVAPFEGRLARDAIEREAQLLAEFNGATLQSLAL